ERRAQRKLADDLRRFVGDEAKLRRDQELDDDLDIGKQTGVDSILHGATSVGPANRTRSTMPWETRPPLEPFQARALREVIAALGPKRSALATATLAAADSANRSPSAGRKASSASSRAGQAMWRATERRAATLYRQ